MGDWYTDDDGTVVLKIKSWDSNGNDTQEEENTRNGLYICGKPDNFDIMFGNNKLGECLYEDSNAFPFIIAGGKLYVGNSSEGHWDIGLQVANIPYEKFFDYNLTNKERYALEVKRDAAVGKLQSYSDYAAGRIWIDVDANHDDINGSCVISFWDALNNSTVVNGNMINELLSYFGVNGEDIYIAIIDNEDDSFGELVKYTGGNLHLSKMSNSQREYYGMHLMNAKDKHNATADFRNTRDRAIYAPREKEAGTLAAYHAKKYPYGEGRSPRKVFLKENQMHRIIIHLKEKYCR